VNVCVVCGREVAEDSELCIYHRQALDNLRATFGDWKRALKINWKEYLNHVHELDETGMWVREIAEHLMSQGSSSES
jgi:hypothetical protein